MPAPANNPLLLRFGPFKLDPRVCELHKGDTLLHLAPQPCKVLALLASRPQKVFTRQEIQREIWGGDTFVDFEQGLNVAIRQIRAALCDDAETPRYIETLTRRGYRFIGRIDEHPVVADGGTPSVPAELATLSAPAVLRPLSYRRPMTVVVGLALTVVAVVLVWRMGLIPRRTPLTHIQSLAVLPLENLSHDPEQEYFADGMTEELITDLAKIHTLRVISRNSMMQYKGKHKPTPQVGKELNVDALVEGSVVRAGDRVRITAQLVEASTDRHLWAESYERELRDVLDLQDDIARAIANQVQAKLTPQEEARLAGASRVNPEAYELYLKGRYEWAKRGRQNLTMGLEFFQRAVSLDPNYAPAWAGVAESYGLLGNGEFVAVGEVYAKAKSAALKALELDPGLSDAHTALAEVLNDYEWNWGAAEREYKRAIELNPNEATAHHWYAMSLIWVGRTAEAIAEIERARELDPAGIHINANVGLIFLWARQYDRAMVQAQKTLELEPNEATSHLILAQVNLHKGHSQRAISELQTVVGLSSESPRSLAWLAWGYALAGQKGKALSILDKIKQLSRRKYCPPTSIAMVYCALGQKDEAFAWLDKALREREGIQLLSIKVNLYFDSLRSDPRFSEVLRRRGLPQ